MPTPFINPPEIGKPALAPDPYITAANAAIGRLIIEFAASEKSLSMVLMNFVQKRFFAKSYSHEGVQILAALSGDIRIERLKTLAAELAARSDSKLEDIKQIASAAAQLTMLQRLRNRISHSGATMLAWDGKWCIQTSNKYNVRDFEKREIWRYSIEVVERAANDLPLAILQISDALNPENRKLFVDNPTYDPHAPFSFHIDQIAREPMPLT